MNKTLMGDINDNRILISKLIQSKLSINEFCSQNNISRGKIQKVIASLAYNDPLYIEYQTALRNKQIASLSNVLEIKEMIKDNCSDEDLLNFFQLHKQGNKLFSWIEEAIATNTFEKEVSERLHRLIIIYDVWHEEKRKKLHHIRREETIDKILDESRELIIMLNQSKLSIPEFCLNNNIDESSVNAALRALEFKNDPVFEEHKKIAQEILKNTFATICKKTQIIANKIINGIDENGVKRKFDIIDYCIEAPMDMNKLLVFMQEVLLNRQEYIALKKFIKENNVFGFLTTSSVMKTEIIVGVKADKNGKAIPGTGRTISDEEKSEILQWLSENKIPLANNTFSAALKRYINFTLEGTNKQERQL